MLFIILSVYIKEESKKSKAMETKFCHAHFPRPEHKIYLISRQLFASLVRPVAMAISGYNIFFRSMGPLSKSIKVLVSAIYRCSLNIEFIDRVDRVD